MPTSPISDSVDSRVWWTLLGVVLLGFVAWTFGELRAATSPRWQDTSGYLAHALYIAEHGGFFGFLREAFTGEFPVVQRHPLYLLMIAPFASRTADFFWMAKMVDLVTGLVLLLSLIWMVNRRYGRGPALIAAVLYAVCNSLVIASSHVNNETQFVLCTLWAWWFLTQPGRHDGPGMPGPKRWAIAGGFLGLAFLAKSPAILMAVAVAVAGLWHARLRFLIGPRPWLLVGAAILVASPLLIRNIVGYGTPLYESINAHIMWLDDWNDRGDEDSIIYYDSYGITTIEANNLPTAAEYFATHSAADMLQRMGEGIRNYVGTVIPTSLGASVLPVGGRMLGFAVFAFALAGWWLLRRSWDATLIFFWSGAFLAFFMWNTMFPEIRYIAPLVPVWIALAAHAIWRIGAVLLGARLRGRLQAAATAGLVLLALGSTVAAGKLTRDYPVMTASASYLGFVDWVNRNAREGDRFMIGETREFDGLIWQIEPRIKVFPSPNVTTVNAFIRYLRERNVRYLLMHPEYLTGENQELAAALQPYFRLYADGTFSEKQPLPGWQRIHRDREVPARFILYEAAHHPSASY